MQGASRPRTGPSPPGRTQHTTRFTRTSFARRERTAGTIQGDEREIAEWLLARGADVNARALVDAEGFGGHTALFSTVVSQPNFWMNYNQREQVAPFTELLLRHGADPNVRASLRKQLHPGCGAEPLRAYRGVTALSWGQRFHRKEFVSEPAMRLIAAHGGVP